MKRKLTAKVQKLNPAREAVNKAFSRGIIIEPETRKMSLQKGTVYAVYDVYSDNDLDTEVISKIVQDILHDGYFQTEDISPTQTLEKTILEIRNKITQMDETKSIKFNMVASVLWGNVLYTVQFGSGKCYLVQEGEIRPVSTVSEGNFSAASGVVNDEDVVILSTEPFDIDYPPKRLLSSAIPETELKPQQAAILMKFIVDTEFSENEVIDFGLEEARKDSKLKEKIRKIFKSIVGNARKKGLAAKLNPKENKKAVLIIIGLLAAAPLIAMAFRKSKPEEPMPNEPDQEEQLLGADIERPQDPWEKEKQSDEENKVMRVSPEAFYDIKIIDDTAKPTEIELVESNIVVAAKNSGKVFISEMDTPNFEKAGLEFPGINSLNDSSGLLSFNDNEGFKYLDTDLIEVNESYELPNLTLTDTYMEFIYSVSGDQIIKYTPSNGVLSESVWDQDPSFEDADSIAIAYSIFIGTNKGELLRYTTGEKDDFSITGLNTPLGKGLKIFADTKLNDIYIMDPDNKRLVVVNDSG